MKFAYRTCWSWSRDGEAALDVVVVVVAVERRQFVTRVGARALGSFPILKQSGCGVGLGLHESGYLPIGVARTAFVCVFVGVVGERLLVVDGRLRSFGSRKISGATTLQPPTLSLIDKVCMCRNYLLLHNLGATTLHETEKHTKLARFNRLCPSKRRDSLRKLLNAVQVPDNGLQLSMNTCNAMRRLSLGRWRLGPLRTQHRLATSSVRYFGVLGAARLLRDGLGVAVGLGETLTGKKLSSILPKELAPVFSPGNQAGSACKFELGA